ncbi:hypothetical protein PHISCL_08565 [Aspergillus sclerotialis]|uniref:Uncharacterized protein n=1 Tax=Aspergillus sclerotialis TaxID=2070753 RepID=A0A3A2ZCR6_9EURO|nr:hypothetical protein PHISCL_08565 [Aspergillus sclerotialis]
MRLSFVILFSLLYSYATATAIRGAAERVWYFTTYLAEEIYMDGNDRSIATGCVGTRTGLRGQANRCTLKELCEHLWAPTDGDTEPDKTATKWQGPATDLSKFDAQRGVNAVKSVTTRQEVWDKKAGKYVMKNVALNPGYTGFTNIGNLVSGATDYYTVNSKVGEYALKAREEYEKVKDSLTSGEKKAFAKWNSENKVAINQVIGLRQKEIAKNVILEMAKPTYFGRPLKTKTNKTWENNPDIKSFEEADREETIKAYASEFGGEDKAATAYDDAFKKLSDTPSAELHAKAINDFKNAKKIMGC